MFSTCTCFAGKAKKLSRPSLPAEKMLLNKLQSHSDAWHSQTFFLDIPTYTFLDCFLKYPFVLFSRVQRLGLYRRVGSRVRD